MGSRSLPEVERESKISRRHKNTPKSKKQFKEKLLKVVLKRIDREKLKLLRTDSPIVRDPLNEKDRTKRIKMSDYLRAIDKLKLDGNISENWRRFKRNFDIFLVASGISGKGEITKINTFLNMIGEDAVEVFDSFKLTEEQSKSYEEVIKSFENFCKPKKNTVYERFMFYQRKQRESEPFDTFHMDIKRLIRTCEFGDKEEEMLRDQIVMGVNDKKLQMRLLEIADLTYTVAIDKCRANEATREQASSMNKTAEVSVVRKNDTNNRYTNHVASNNNNSSRDYKRNSNGRHTSRNTNSGERYTQQQQKQQRQQHTQNRSQSSNRQSRVNENEVFSCKKCNLTHKFRQCPAYGKICSSCLKPNHYSVACKSKSVSTVAFDNEEFYIGTIENKDYEDSDSIAYPWIEKIRVKGKHIKFKIDTGAEVNVVSLKLFKMLGLGFELRETNVRLRAFGGQRIKPIGMCSLFGDFNNKSKRMLIAVVDMDVNPILGLKSCVDFGLVNPSRKQNSHPTPGKNL